MNTQYQQKPTLLNVIAWTTLISGIVNIVWGIAAFTTFIGVICAPISILPILLGSFELSYAAKLLSNPTQLVTPSTNLAVFEVASLLYGNAFSMVVGILALVFYNDTVVKDYFARLNGTPEPAKPITQTDPAPDKPAPLPQPEPVLVVQEPVSDEIDEPAPLPSASTEVKEPPVASEKSSPSKPKKASAKSSRAKKE